MPWLKSAFSLVLGNVTKEPSLCKLCPLKSKERQFLQIHMIFHAMDKNQHAFWSLGNVTLFEEPSLCNLCPLKSRERQFLQKTYDFSCHG